MPTFKIAGVEVTEEVWNYVFTEGTPAQRGAATRRRNAARRIACREAEAKFRLDQLAAMTPATAENMALEAEWVQMNDGQPI